MLLGVGDHSTVDLQGHLDLHGSMPDLRRISSGQLIELVAAAGVRGRGGASFPVAVKLRSVASRRWQKIVLANGAEGEPASKKDRVLLRERPHLVLDGISLAAGAVRAREAIVAVAQDDERGLRGIARAIEERTRARMPEPRLSVLPVPARYISGQETALVNLVNTGTALPTFGTRPFERGVRQRPTLVQNVETLAHLALIARHGAGWFRELGTAEDPGSALITLSGAARAPGVYEIEQGMPLADLLEDAGAAPAPRAVLIGGYFGAWIDGTEIERVLLDRETLAAFRASLGAGIIVVLGPDSCAVSETARVAKYFSAEGAGQCGPCVNGLAAVADTIARIQAGTAPHGALADLNRWCSELPGRGACGHPDGAVRFVSSALRVFASEFEAHARRGRCELCHAPAVLPTPRSDRLPRAA
ncbi:MAG TPA: NADH-ubiquinone oxidoreductase-F iron-sulfur binding region domain-containing protein [Solirubrobacteraceae bacterium]|nr:NADH-ubiquinone oxidoreductase-F iron-sulfur binding region domain-containing protein [Solirubrobacteraceae bacterium]